MGKALVTGITKNRTGLRTQEINLHFDSEEHINILARIPFVTESFNLLTFDSDVEAVKIEVLKTYEGALEGVKIKSKGYIDTDGEPFIIYRYDEVGIDMDFGLYLSGERDLYISYFCYVFIQAMHCKADLRITAYLKPN